MFLFHALLLAALSSSPHPTPLAQETPARSRAVTCTLSNPSYSGHCKVTEQAPATQSANDACQAVLDCLNNVQCLKSYCNATQVRGGWRLVSAREGTGD